MKLCLKIAGTALLTLTLATAASTQFVSSWKNPEAASVDISGKRWAAFVVSPDQSMRLGPEETLATEMRKRGVDCIAGYTVLPGELAKDKEKAKEFLEKGGITGAIMMRVLSEEERIHHTPATVYYTSSYYPSFWGYWGHGWSTVYVPGYTTAEKVISIETLVYSIDRDMLLWAGESETTDPKEVRKFVKQLVDAVGKEMRKTGLVRQ
jgi:hypothetical protein